MDEAGARHENLALAGAAYRRLAGFAHDLALFDGQWNWEEPVVGRRRQRGGRKAGGLDSGRIDRVPVENAGSSS